MKVKIKYIDETAKDLYLKASDGKYDKPYKTYDDDFCYDVIATSCKEVAPNVYKYGLGLAFQIERGMQHICTDKRELNKGMFKAQLNDWYYGFCDSPLNLSIDFRPRSSVWKTGMILSNCEGTIDELYTGEVSAVFYHVMPTMPKYEVGDRIGQIKIGVTIPMEFVEVEELSETERASGGYGSTGK